MFRLKIRILDIENLKMDRMKVQVAAKRMFKLFESIFKSRMNNLFSREVNLSDAIKLYRCNVEYIAKENMKENLARYINIYDKYISSNQTRYISLEIFSYLAIYARFHPGQILNKSLLHLRQLNELLITPMLPIHKFVNTVISRRINTRIINKSKK